MGTMTPHGKVLIPPLYTSYYRGNTKDDPYRVIKDHHYHGVVKRTGEVIIPAIYEEFHSKKKYKDKYRVMLNGEVGLVDLEGSYIRRYDTDVNRPIPNFPNGAHIYPTYEGDNAFGIIDSAGNEIVPKKFKKIKFYNGKYGVVATATARGCAVQECKRRVYRTIKNLCIEDMQLRRDVGLKAKETFEQIREWNWL